MNKRLKSFTVCILIGAMIGVILFKPLAYAQVLPDEPPETTADHLTETEQTAPVQPTETEAETNSSSPDSVSTDNDITRHTITYLSGDEIYQTVSVLHNTHAAEPPAPELPAGKNSFLGWYTDDGSRYFFHTLVTGDLTLHAAFSEQFLVQFLVDGQVVDSDLVDPGQPVIQTQYTPLAPDGNYFLYWYEAGQDENQPYDFQGGVTRNLILVPYFSASHYVFFYSEGTPVPEQLVKHGEKIVLPQIPERIGYTFLGWSLEPDQEVFFDEELPITDSLTLYAVWKPEMVEYTVVYWLEKANLKDTFDVSDSTHYSFAYTEQKQALAGSIVKGRDVVSDEPHQSLDHSEFSHGSTAVVLGNGTTLVNVYYTRTIYTLRFHLGESDLRDYYYQDPDGILHLNNDDPYLIMAKFEEDITDRWPCLLYYNSNKPNLYSSDDGYKFTGWLIHEGHTSESPTLTSRRQTLTDDLIPRGYTEYNLDAVWETDTQLYYLNYMVQSLDNEEGENVDGTLYQRDMTLSQYAQSSLTWKFKDIPGLIPYHIEIKTDLEPGVTHVFLYYQRQHYQLMFDAQGGEFFDWGAGPWNYMYQQPLDEPADPFRGGYLFTGWYLDSQFRERFDFEDATMPAHDLLLFAGWESTDHTITFYDGVNGEKLSSSGIQTNSFIPMPSHYEIGKGYREKGIFSGWYWYDSSGRFVSFPFEMPVTKDMDVYASWQTEGFELTYYGGDNSTGTVPTDHQTYSLDKLALIQNADLTMNGQRFIGWQIDGIGVTYWPGNALEMYGHVSLHAKYTKPGMNYNMITFYGNGGTNNGAAEMTALFEQGSKEIPLSAAADFTKPGHVLTGWSETEEADTAEYKTDGIYAGPLTEDLALYAVWKAEDVPVLTITAHSAQKEYDGTPLTNDGYEVSAAADTYDSIEGILISGEITDVGTAANTTDISDIKIIKNGQDITAACEIITVDGTLEISPRSALIEVDNKEKHQGQADPAFTGKAKNLVSIDDLGDIIYHRADQDRDKQYAGAAITITAEYTANENYIVTVADGTLTILNAIQESENPAGNKTVTPRTDDETSLNLFVIMIIAAIVIVSILIHGKKQTRNS